MAKVLTDDDGGLHLRGADGDALCGKPIVNKGVTDGTLTCSDCAGAALLAVELVTKAEKREWRKL